MRNLKRALSLALASVMLLGMMVVGTSASYPDVDSSNNQEAIEVLQMVGIMTGDEKGNFNPDAYVTRNEMAVVMCNLLDLKIGGTSPFVDVPAWAQPYVAACYANGTIAGISKTEFGGDANVTAVQAGLMVMKALGYFEYQGEFDDDWQLATVKQAALINLFDDIDAAVTAPLTRSEVAQLVLNALESTVVVTKEYGGMKVEGNGITVTEKATYSHTPVSNESNDYTSQIDGVQQLTEKLFGVKLKKTTVQEDDFGRPASKWTYKSSSVTAPESPDAVYTAEVASKTIYSDLSLGQTTTATVYTDGGDNATSFVVKKGDSDTKIGGNGIKIEAYKDDKSDSVTLVVINTYFGEISKVTASNDNGEPAVTVKQEGEEFETAASFAKGDYVAYTKAVASDGSVTIKSVKALEKVAEVDVTKKTAASSFVAGGTTYKYTKNWNGAKANTVADTTVIGVDKTMDLYLDQYGYVLFAEVFSGSDNYAYVLKAGTDNGVYDDDDVYYAQLLLADGTVVDAEVVKVDGKDSDKDGFHNVVKGDIVVYTKNSKDEYTLDTCAATAKTGKVDVSKGESKMTVGGNTYYANSKTIFLLQKGTGNSATYTAYTGYANVPNLKASNVDSAVYCKSGTVATVVYIKGASATTDETDIIYVLATKNPDTINDTDAGTYYQYKAVVNGEITTIALDEKLANTADVMFSSVAYDEYDVVDVSESEIFTTDSTEDDYVITGVAAGEIKDDVLTIGSTTYAVSADLETYKVKTGDKISAGNDADIDTGVTLTAVVSKGEIISIFYVG